MINQEIQVNLQLEAVKVMYHSMKVKQASVIQSNGKLVLLNK